AASQVADRACRKRQSGALVPSLIKGGQKVGAESASKAARKKSQHDANPETHLHLRARQELTGPQPVDNSGQPFRFDSQRSPSRAGEAVVAPPSICFHFLKQTFVEQSS